MKQMTVLTVLAIALLTFSGCAGLHPFQHDEKYNLDDQLEMVTQIQKYTMRDWQKVDSQSFVLQTGASNYYLIVLLHPSTELMFAETIKISSTGAVVKSGFDKVTVYQAGRGQDYVIHKMYKFKDRQQMTEIKAQLTGK